MKSIKTRSICLLAGIFTFLALIINPGHADFSLVPGPTNLDLFSGQAWTFIPGAEFPGATGSFQLGKDGDKNVGILTFDFTKGGNYVAGQTTTQIPDTVTEIRFNAKSKANASLFVRLTDSSDQTHQIKYTYSTPGQWQTFRVDLKGSLDHFGGPNDGTIHFPIKQICLMVGHSKDAAEAGDISFSDVTVLQ